VREGIKSPWVALGLLTTLNILNYVDRSVLFAVQPLIQQEFGLSNARVGFLTSSFLIVYMIAAPVTAPLADRASRKRIIAYGGLFWSALTLLTAVTHSYWSLLVRHALVGVGEATFVTVAPTFAADLVPLGWRGRVLGVFYLAIPVGTAAGYLLGGHLGPTHGWRMPFYVAAAPGFLISLLVLFLKEPERGRYDTFRLTAEKMSLRGLTQNPAFWSATLGMAAMTFALGGVQVWMPTYLSRARGFSLEAANRFFGTIIVVDGALASLFGGWLGDRLLPRVRGSYYFVSAVSMALGVPVMALALYGGDRFLIPGMWVGSFLLLVNTAPLNAALVNSVGASIRVTAIAFNMFLIHLLGDVPSPWLMGLVADWRSLSLAFVFPVIAMSVSSAILFRGMRYAPPVREGDAG
jgi:predicted MFS family arabinose efflux permease